MSRWCQASDELCKGGGCLGMMRCGMRITRVLDGVSNGRVRSGLSRVCKE